MAAECVAEGSVYSHVANNYTFRLQWSYVLWNLAADVSTSFVGCGMTGSDMSSISPHVSVEFRVSRAGENKVNNFTEFKHWVTFVLLLTLMQSS